MSPPRISAALVAVLLGSACGDGVSADGGEPFDPGIEVAVVVDYPLNGSWTDSSRVTVRGRVSSLPAGFALLVDGAAVSVDSFGEWRTTVDLDQGPNSIRATAEVDRAVVGEASVVVGRTGFVSSDVTGLVVEPGGAGAWVLDRAARRLSRVDLASGRSTEISGPNVGGGESWSRPFGLVVDAAAQMAWVRSEPASIVSVDLQTGLRRLVSTTVPWSGAAPTGSELARGATPQSLFAVTVASTAPPNPSLVSLHSGGVPDGSVVPTVVSRGASFGGFPLGAGPSFACPCALATPTGHPSTVWLTRPNGARLDWMSVDVSTGDRTVRAPPVGSLAFVGSTSRVSFTAFGSDLWLVADPVGGRLHRFDTANNTSSSIADSTEPWQPTHVAIDPLSSTVVVADQRGDRLFVVDAAASSRRAVTTISAGDGPAFVRPTAITRLPDSRLVVGDGGLNALIAVDRATGNRRILSGAGVGIGPALNEPTCISAADGLGNLLVVDSGTDRLLIVDPVSGDRDVVLTADSIRSARVDVFTGLAFVATRDRILRFELENPAAIETVIGPDIGFGVPLLDVRAIWFDAGRDALVCLDTEPVGDGLVRSRFVEVHLGDAPTPSSPTPNVVARVLAIDFQIRPVAEGPVRPASMIRFGSSSTLLAADSAAGRLLLLDRTSSTVSNAISGSANAGPAWAAPAAVTIDGSVPVVFAVDLDRAAVLTFDPLSGERLILSR